MKLADKKVFITGAASGIGYQIALAFAREGAHIIATDIDPSGLDVLAQEPDIQKGNFDQKILDVRDANAYGVVVRELVEAGKIPDVLINNAGLGVFRRFSDTSLEDWQLTMDVNVMGVVHGCKFFTDVWFDREMPGHIVNLSSMASLAPIPNMTAYVASKMAVEGFSDVLAMELTDTDISVTCVHPGIIDTPIVRHNDRYGFSKERIARIQKYYRDKGVLPIVVAEDIVKAVRNQTPTLLSGTDVLKVKWGRKLLPKAIYLKMIIKQARDIGFLPRK